MLIRFKVRNFRSLRNEQQLSFEATSLRGNAEAISAAEPTQHRLLRAAAIYGANASGKTNVLRALIFMRDAVRNSQKDWDPEAEIDLQMFAGTDALGASARFEVDFLLDGVLYQYGFELTSTKIVEEWLHAYPSKKKQMWFVRGESFQFGRNLPGENQTIANLTRRNSLFLSAAAQNNHEALLPVYRWFSSIQFVRSWRRELQGATSRLCEDEAFKKKVLRMLSAADLGVVDIDAHEEEFQEPVKGFSQKMKTIFPEFKLPEKTTVISLRHRSSDGSDDFLLPLQQESDGTVAYFSLLGPLIQTLSDGGILCVDELDASLHPVLALQIVLQFNTSERNPKGAQLLFNTHDTNLLSKDLLRRDQVWFTEKDQGGATHLYSLTDFKPRRNENLQLGYLEGRYGALPFIGNADVLPE
jgi:AAA15 family ATPase/GTPase